MTTTAKKIQIYCDGSFDQSTKTGWSAVLMFDDLEARDELAIANRINYRQFENTTCTRLELQGVLWGFDLFLESQAKNTEKIELTLYTDCKTAADLPQRRENLESKCFKSKKTGLDLSNADLYREFFRKNDLINSEIVWLKGHLSKDNKTIHEKIFSQVDRDVRQKMRSSRNPT